MADRWIVSAWKFKEHSTLEAAEKEVERLRTLAPKKTFVVHRKKTTLQASNAGALIAEWSQIATDAIALLDQWDANLWDKERLGRRVMDADLADLYRRQRALKPLPAAAGAS